MPYHVTKTTSSQLGLHLLALLITSIMLVSCSQLSPMPRTPPPKLDSVETWIRQHAIPFKTAEPGGSDEDLQPFEQIVDNATIVGLGEATHGTHEFFTMKHRILEFLVSHMGFNTFAMENGWDASRPMDTYVMTGSGNPRDLLRQDFYAAWQTQEVLDLLAWMRAYNANPAHRTKVHFAGIDSWNVTRSAFDGVVNFIQNVDPQQAALVQALYAGFRPTGGTPVFADYDGFSRLPQATKQRYQHNAQQAYDVLKTHQAAYESRSSPQAFALALQSARVIVQYTTLGVFIPASGSLFTSDQAYARRDAFMAENVSWLHDHEGSGARIVLWAHNTHIANLRRPSGMGTFLRQQFKESYLAIGTSFYQGAFTIFASGSARIFKAAAPGADTYNYTLGHVGIPRYILDIRPTPARPVTDWVQGTYVLINYGVGGQDLEVVGPLQHWFDVIIHFQDITPSHLLSP